MKTSEKYAKPSIQGISESFKHKISESTNQFDHFYRMCTIPKYPIQFAKSLGCTPGTKLLGCFTKVPLQFAKSHQQCRRKYLKPVLICHFTEFLMKLPKCLMKLPKIPPTERLAASVFPPLVPAPPLKTGQEAAGCRSCRGDEWDESTPPPPEGIFHRSVHISHAEPRYRATELFGPKWQMAVQAYSRRIFSGNF